MSERMKSLLLFAVIAGLVSVMAPASAQTWDAADQFSDANNPNGVWSYGYQMDFGSSLNLYTEIWRPITDFVALTSNVGGWNGFVCKNSRTEAVNQWGWFEAGGLAFQPGVNNEKSTVRWTSPVDGYVAVIAKFTGQDPSGATTDVHVLYNSMSIFDGTINGFIGTSANDFKDGLGASRSQEFARVIPVTTGDTIDFCAGYGNGSATYDLTGLNSTISVTTAPPGTISGQIVTDNASRTPIDQATVKTSDGKYSTTSDADGMYTLVVPAGTYELTASHKLYKAATASVTVDVNSAVNQDLVLQTGFISGTIIRNDDATPIVGATVITSDGLYYAVSGDDGSYSLQVPPGAYTVNASAGGYITSSPVDVTVTNDSTANNNFSLDLESVFDASKDFSQYANPNGVWSYGYQIIFPGELNLYDWVRADYPGFYGWDVSAGSWAGFVCKNTTDKAFSHYGWFEAGEMALQAGSLDEKATVRWTSPISGDIVVNVRFTGQDPLKSTTDVHVLKNGESLFSGDINGYIGSSANDFLDGSGDSRVQNKLLATTVAEGDTIDFCIGNGGNGTGYDMTGLSATITSAENAPGTISGKVTEDAPGNPPIPGANVRTADGLHSAMTDSNGDYVLYLPAGTYELTASAKGYVPEVKSVDVSAAANVTANFALKTGIISGKVTLLGDSNMHIAGALVATSDGLFSTVTAADGTYSMHIVPGSYSIVVSAAGFATSTFTDITVAGSDPFVQDFGLTPKSEFNACADFPSSVVNPNGVWSYGYKATLDGTLLLFDGFNTPAVPGALGFASLQALNASGWPGFVCKNTASGSVSQWGWFEAGQLAFQGGTGNEKSTVRWTSPVDATVSIKVRFTGQDEAGTTTDVHVMKNGVSLFDNAINGFIGKAANGFTDGTGDSREQNFTGDVPVVKGDIIDFCVGYGDNGNTVSDMTGLDAIITVPEVSVKAVISELKGIKDGTLVTLTELVVATAYSTTFADGSYYVETSNRANGIKVIGGGNVSIGDTITDLTGTVMTDANGERYIQAQPLSVTSGNPLRALGMSNKGVISPLVTGLLVRTWGAVIDNDGSYITINDGSDVTFKVVISDLSTPITKSVAKGDHIAVTGLAGLAKYSDTVVPVILPRGDFDIDLY